MRKSLKPSPVPEQNLTSFNCHLKPKATAFNLTGVTNTPHKPQHHRKENIQVIKTNVITLRKSTRRVACFTFPVKDSTSGTLQELLPNPYPGTASLEEFSSFLDNYFKTDNSEFNPRTDLQVLRQPFKG